VDGYANEGADRTMQHAGSCGGKNLILATFLDEELLSVFSEEEGGKRENLSCIIFCTKKKHIYDTLQHMVRFIDTFTIDHSYMRMQSNN
jgi:hypothetical protein